MPTEFKTNYKRSILDSHPRELYLHPDFIQFTNKDLATAKVSTFKLADIKDFRYGIRWYRYYFVFGREYQIYIRNIENEVIKINFSTYFGRKKKEYHQLYSDIINTLWVLYFKEQTNQYLKEFKSNESFQIGETNINPEGIIIKVSKLTKLERQLIKWEDIGIKKYWNYFSIYSIKNPREIHRGYLYKEDWNTFVLQTIVETILKDKNIEQ